MLNPDSQSLGAPSLSTLDSGSDYGSFIQVHWIILSNDLCFIFMRSENFIFVFFSMLVFRHFTLNLVTMTENMKESITAITTSMDLVLFFSIYRFELWVDLLIFVLVDSSYYWVRMWGDPTFEFHASLARVLGLLVKDLAGNWVYQLHQLKTDKINISNVDIESRTSFKLLFSGFVV
jgi:hypothetical protein